MQIIKIPKRNGKFRTIYVPDSKRKAACRELLPHIMGAAERADRHGVQHGFTRDRSPVTNAMAHIGWQYTLKMDLKDFFDTVTREHLSRALVQTPRLDYWDDNCIALEGGAARQGLPTSPAVANLAAAGMDNDIMALQIRSRFVNFIYTRYADDLTFSFNHPELAAMLIERVPQIVKAHGFAVNESKTRLQWIGAGRRHITGVAIDGSKLHMTRAVKRRLRAARHQIKSGLAGRNLKRLAARQNELIRIQGREVSMNALLVDGYKGLLEWSRLRMPKTSSSRGPQVLGCIPQTNNAIPTRPLIFGGGYNRKFA